MTRSKHILKSIHHAQPVSDVLTGIGRTKCASFGFGNWPRTIVHKASCQRHNRKIAAHGERLTNTQRAYKPSIPG
jgi:hypothetical protein